jgi:hypothetical protein
VITAGVLPSEGDSRLLHAWMQARGERDHAAFRLASAVDWGIDYTTALATFRAANFAYNEAMQAHLLSA